MKHLYLFGLLLSLPFFGFSQGEFNNWYFGEHAGLNFASGTPVVLTNCSPLFFCDFTTATVSDSSGNLLFYADYSRVFNRNHARMPNGSGLYSNGVAYQPVLPVKNLVDDSTYYLFTMDITPYPGYTNKGLRYSVIDMRLNGGFGDIPNGQKNIVVPGAAQTSNMLTGTRHHNNHDVWIIVRNYTNDNYLSYMITNAGINTVPVISHSLVPDTYYSGTTGHSDTHVLKISPDGSRVVALYDTVAEFCRFNDTTGEITPLFCFKPTSAQPNFQRSGAEFSVDSKFLYVSCETTAQSGDIYQYNATKTDSTQFKQSEQLIYTTGYSVVMIGCGLQRAVDNKIYATVQFVDSLNIINYPNIQGAGCGFTHDAICLLPTNEGWFGFPTFIQKYKAYINTSGECTGNAVLFISDIWPPADTIMWNFGDPASGGFNVSNLPNPSHIYALPGSYSVELYIRHNDNRTDTTWKLITILQSPVPVLGPNRTVCTGDSVTFDAGACVGCTYLWKDLGSGLTVGTSQTFKTGLAGTYSVNVTNSDGCIGSDTVQLITTAVPSVTNNPLSKTICSGDSTEITLTSNVTGTTFHWTASLTSGNITGFSADSGSIINQVLINNGATTGIVTYHITPKVGSCIGDPVDYAVSVTQGTAVTINITSSTNNVCQGTSVTFNAHTTYGGASPLFQWKVNGVITGLNDSIFTYTPANADVVTCTITSSNTICVSNNPATSNSITMVIFPLQTVSVSVSGLNPVCAGTSVTYTATPSNGGLSPTYQWKVNGIIQGANLSTYTYVPINGDVITCTVLSNATCPTNNPATSPPITMTVNPNLPVGVSISTPSNPFCLGSSVTFTATPSNGGIPIYLWMVNGVNAGGNSSTYTYTPAGGDDVTCIMTSSLPCTTGNPATSNSITMVVNTGLPAGVSITASQNSFCPGTTVTFTATPSNGGSTPAYQWKVNGNNVGINSSTYTYNPINNDSIRCVMTSNLSCVTGNPASSNKIIMSGTLAPIVSFTSCFDTITTINAKPIKLKGGIPLGGTYSGPGVNSLTGIYTPSLAGVGTHTITYSYTNAALCTASKSISILNLPSSILSCGNPLTDVRDNKVYPTVQIGSQCWLATNLNYGTILTSSQDQRDNCQTEKYCYNDNPINCINQGGLYQWDKLMLFDETPADQGFCPPGWHIPTENEWNTLFANYINSGFAGSPLKYSGYSGFNALLSGARHINKGWDLQGFATFFWSSTQLGSAKAWAHGMNDDDPSVSSYPSSRVNAFSVRCLKD